MARLLLIHTGGTISMVPGAQGFAPEAGVAEALAREIVRRDMPDIELEIRAFDPLIDSADIRPAHWNRLLDLIGESRGRHRGIVVTHGTDTLAYTAAALFSALKAPACPVIVTGAMRPAAREGSDAAGNLRAALEEARDGPPGVRVCFAGKTMAAARVVKVSSSALDAFREIPLPDHAAAACRDDLSTAERFADKRVGVVTLSPGLTAEAFDATLGCLDGAVLRCYGSGTVPSDPAIRLVLYARIRRGLAVLAISQCEHGGLRPGEYAAGAALREAGVIDGAALTTEAAVAKLALMLSAPPARGGLERDDTISDSIEQRKTEPEWGDK